MLEATLKPFGEATGYNKGYPRPYRAREVKDEHLADNVLAKQVVALRRRNAELEAAEAERDRAWAWLRQNEEHYRAAVENVADAIVITVGTTRVFVNQAFLILHELDDMSQASGLALDHFIVTEDRPMVSDRTLARERGEPAPGLYEYRIRRTNGEVRTVETSAVAITFDGQPATLAVLRDISQRKEAERALHENEERIRRLAEIGQIISSSLNIDDVYGRFAAKVRELIAFERIVITVADLERSTFTTAYAMGGEVADRRRGDVSDLASSVTQEVIRTRSGLILQSEDVEELIRRFSGPLPAYQAGFRSFLSVPLIASDKVIGALHLESTSPEAYTEQDLNLALSIAAQISGAIANAQLFEQLETGEEELRRLTQKVIEAQEEERHRVSRELHDEAGQALTALKISLDLIRSDLSVDTGPLHQRILGAVDLTDTTMEKIRLLARGLRPPELDAVGLNPTLEGFCREFAQLTQLSIDYSGVEMPTLPDTFSISFYRFLQEALANVAKHAMATRVRVELSHNADAVSLMVEDDGRGFIPGRPATGAGQSKGIGLLGMEERFELLGGRLKVESRPGQGTRLVAQVPRKEYP